MAPTLPMTPTLLVEIKPLQTTLAARYALHRPLLTATLYAMRPGSKALSILCVPWSAVYLDCAFRQRGVIKRNSDNPSFAYANYIVGRPRERGHRLRRRTGSTCYLNMTKTFSPLLRTDSCWLTNHSQSSLRGSSPLLGDACRYAPWRMQDCRKQRVVRGDVSPPLECRDSDW